MIRGRWLIAAAAGLCAGLALLFLAVRGSDDGRGGTTGQAIADDPGAPAAVSSTTAVPDAPSPAASPPETATPIPAPSPPPVVLSGTAVEPASPPAPPVAATAAPRPAAATTSAIVSFHLSSIGLDARWPVEARDTVRKSGQLYFEDPRNPQAIAWYPGYSSPGAAGGNTLVAAHVDYYTGAAVPFARLRMAQPGEALTVRFADGSEITYLVRALRLVPTAQIDLADLIYPALDANTERLTLMSCGGDFIRNPSGVGGEYASRLIVTAERRFE